MTKDVRRALLVARRMFADGGDTATTTVAPGDSAFSGFFGGKSGKSGEATVAKPADKLPLQEPLPATTVNYQNLMPPGMGMITPASAPGGGLPNVPGFMAGPSGFGNLVPAQASLTAPFSGVTGAPNLGAPTPSVGASGGFNPSLAQATFNYAPAAAVPKLIEPTTNPFAPSATTAADAAAKNVYEPIEGSGTTSESDGPGDSGDATGFASGGHVGHAHVMDPHDLPGIHVRTAHTFAAGGATDNQDEGEGFDAYHGSPHAFEKFDLGKIGTGEGAQAYGHGMYFAENEGIARGYRDALSKRRMPGIPAGWGSTEDTPREGSGHLYHVRIKANPKHFLDWDAPLSEQHPKVREGVLSVIRAAKEDEANPNSMHGTVQGAHHTERGNPDEPHALTGAAIHDMISRVYGHEQQAQTLHAAGIPGIKYWDAGSRAQGQGTRNYVIFNPDIIHVKRRYADGGLIQDKYPTHYMPNVGRQVMADGGDLGSDPMVQKAMDVAQQTQPRPVEGAVGVAKKIVRRGAKSSPAPQLGEDHPAWIPQRLVTSKKATAPQGKDVVDLAALKSTPELYGKNVDLLREYPNVKTRVAQNPRHDAVANHFIDHVTDNLLALHDMIPEEIRNRSKLWYEGANKIAHQWAKEYNLPVHSVAGVLAALSPQKDWYQNVSLAKRVLETMRGNGGNYYHGFPFNEKMHNTFNNIEAFQKPEYQGILNILHGKTLGDLDRLNLDSKTKNAAKAIWIRLHDQSYNSPSFQIISPEGNVGENVLTKKGAPAKLGWGSAVEISKAIRSIEAAQDPDALSQLMGEKHKVRNFYNNILSPNSRHGDVTIDTHAVAAGLWRPLTGNSLEVAHNFANSTPKGMPAAGGSAISGVQGTYPLYAEAYRRAAAARGILPREMQSITWEAIRGMFPEDWKTKKNMAKIDDIWNQYRRGRVSAQDARSMVHEAAGGIQHPSWFVGGVGQPNEGGRSSGDAGTLPESGVYGAPTGTTYARARGGIATLPSSGPGYSFDQKVRQDPATILRALALSRSITKGT